MSLKHTPISQSLELIQRQTTLRKISQTDKFPCFECMDKPAKRFKCKQCLGFGYINGDHPMVQFAQQFIQKKLSKQINNKSIKLQKQSLEKPERLSMNELESSSQINGNQSQIVLHKGIQCDYCKMYPIKGSRYYCKQCKDFDLCKDCYQKGIHQHPMEVIDNPNKLNISTRPKQEILKKLKQSGRIR